MPNREVWWRMSLSQQQMCVNVCVCVSKYENLLWMSIHDPQTIFVAHLMFCSKHRRKPAIVGLGSQGTWWPERRRPRWSRRCRCPPPSHQPGTSEAEISAAQEAQRKHGDQDTQTKPLIVTLKNGDADSADRICAKGYLSTWKWLLQLEFKPVATPWGWFGFVGEIPVHLLLVFPQSWIEVW